MKTSPCIVLLFVLCAVPLPAGAAEIFERVRFPPWVSPADLYGSARGTALGHADLTRGTSDSPWSNPGALVAHDDGIDTDFAFVPDYRFETSDLWTYAVGVTRGPLRLALSGRRYDGYSVVRTAFEPEGSRLEFVRDDVAVALAVDVNHFLSPDSDVEWTFGMAYRRIGSLFANDSVHALDLGTTVAVAPTSLGPVRRVALAGVLLNVTDATREDDSGDPFAPARAIRGGLTVTLAAPGREAGGDLLVTDLSIAYTDALDGPEAWHFGGEAVVLGHLVLRGGYHGLEPYDTVSYGAALRGRLAHGVTGELQWTFEDPLDPDEAYLRDPESMAFFGARLARGF